MGFAFRLRFIGVLSLSDTLMSKQDAVAPGLRVHLHQHGSVWGLGGVLILTGSKRTQILDFRISIRSAMLWWCVEGRLETDCFCRPFCYIATVCTTVKHTSPSLIILCTIKTILPCIRISACSATITLWQTQNRRFHPDSTLCVRPSPRLGVRSSSWTAT